MLAAADLLADTLPGAFCVVVSRVSPTTAVGDQFGSAHTCAQHSLKTSLKAGAPLTPHPACHVR